MKNGNLNFKLLIFYSSFLIFTSCSLQKQISRSATQLVLKDSSLTTAHVGISIYEPATNKYWFNYQGDHYFVPASNTKIPTCYAAMKYLGDSLVGLKYDNTNDSEINIYPTADPTFLHGDFKNQPVLNFLKQKDRRFHLTNNNWEESPLGSGWSWNDYNANYMAERSAFPFNGNTIKVRLKDFKYISSPSFSYSPVLTLEWRAEPHYFEPSIPKTYDLPLKESATREMHDSTIRKKTLRNFSIQRSIAGNSFSLLPSGSPFTSQELPFYTNNDSAVVGILQKDYSLDINVGFFYEPGRGPIFVKKIYSQPTDSLLKPMMHRSDNFFAEQTLLMVSNERLGVMNDEKIIDTLLKTDFKDLPQKPRWADGSGLSRYNLFTPQDFVAIFNKMKNEFGMDRIKNIFPTGGEGTLSNYYKAENGYLFGKTGSLSGVVALSGFLHTKKNKLLIFSVLVNNHNASATAVRRAVEKFIEGIRNNY